MTPIIDLSLTMLIFLPQSSFKIYYQRVDFPSFESVVNLRKTIDSRSSVTEDFYKSRTQINQIHINLNHCTVSSLFKNNL